MNIKKYGWVLISISASLSCMKQELRERILEDFRRHATHLGDLEHVKVTEQKISSFLDKCTVKMENNLLHTAKVTDYSPTDITRIRRAVTAKVAAKAIKEDKQSRRWSCLAFGISTFFVAATGIANIVLWNLYPQGIGSSFSSYSNGSIPF